MSDLFAAIKESDPYKALLSAFASSRAPHAILAQSPALFHEALAVEIARLYLCANGSGDDDCASCLSWKGGEHPDFIRPLQWDRPPGIDDCRAMAGELYLAPVIAPRRFAVIPNAGKLSLPAANSLLKILEEPPSWGALLLLSEEMSLLPTIKSRTWHLKFDFEEELSPLPLPKTRDEWLSTIARASKMSFQEAAATLERWIKHCLEEGDLVRAEKLGKVELLFEKGRLPVYMAFDLLFGFLEEDLPDELFGHFR